MAAVAPPTLQLATRSDALGIARMSRDRIECGLGWRWTARRVLGSIDDAETNVLIAVQATQVIGFGIMKYREDEAHLLLLAVQAASTRRGLGAALVAWLERSAATAGVSRVLLESRAANAAALGFYRHLGYCDVGQLPGYYLGREAAVRMAKVLTRAQPSPT